MITELGFALAAAGWASTHLRVAQLQRRLRTDALTGVGNRLALEQVATRSAGRPTALFMLDLNEFKAINDTFGHRYGDQVLVHVARRLRALQSRGQLAVRLSGDEFAFWAGRWQGGQHFEELKRRLAAAVAEPMTIDGYTITVTASVGGAAGTGRVGLDDLLATADQDMYRGKRTSGAAGRPSRRRATAA
ncbi:GGDEF domain-containing protein [Saccharopolyspora griseoalba]|uniref:GGDEF domain-containing protein n=1 Tax=Saccharopolyspora griseoalba TaxID=1431848 RepID=A0ABW2LMM5_9PSEU